MSATTRLFDEAINAGSFVLDGQDRCLEHRAFDELSWTVADRLLGAGLSPGEAVIVVIDNRSADVAAFFGAWRAGAVVVPTHASTPEIAARTLAQRVGARFRIEDGMVVTLSETSAPRPLDPSLAFVIFTSGSTGVPKGVALRHDTFAGKIQAIARRTRLTSSDVVVMPLQLTFVMGIWVTLVSMLAGARVRLVSRFSVIVMEDAIAEGATVVTAVPSMFRSMISGERRYPAPLRMWFTGGEPPGADLGRRLVSASPQAVILDMYGSTETNACDFCFDSGADRDGFGTIGRPMEDVEFKIVDADGHEVPHGAEGELLIRSAFFMSHYHNDPALTEAALRGDYFITGDIARLRSDGLVEFAGRSKDLISRGGTKIAPLEIESLFLSHPDVNAAVCTGIPDARLGETIHVMVVPRVGATLTSEGLRSWARDRTERFKLPDAIHFVAELPVGRTGKADRLEVRHRLQALSSPGSSQRNCA